MAEKTVPAPSAQSGRNGSGNGNGNREVTRAPQRHLQPPVDIYETPEALVLMADLPGVSKENLDVRVQDEMLTIQAKAEDAVPGDPIYREFELSSFFRQFELGEEIDTQRINAELKHGVMTLQLPKAEKAKPKRIEVKVS